MAIGSFEELFCGNPEQQQAQADANEGYLAGSNYATWIHENILEVFEDRSKAYREGVLQALREQL